MIKNMKQQKIDEQLIVPHYIHLLGIYWKIIKQEEICI